MILLDLNWNELNDAPRCRNCVGQLEWNKRRVKLIDNKSAVLTQTADWVWNQQRQRLHGFSFFLVRGRLPPVGWGHPAGSNWASLIMKADEQSWQSVIDGYLRCGRMKRCDGETVSSEAAFVCYLPLWFSLFLWEWITIALFSASHLLPSFSCLSLLSPNCLLC